MAMIPRFASLEDDCLFSREELEEQISYNENTLLKNSYFCIVCEEIFIDKSKHIGFELKLSYGFCNNCNNVFCSNECGKIITNEDDKITTCIICRKEFATDEMLLNMLSKHYKITRKEIFEIYKNKKE